MHFLNLYIAKIRQRDPAFAELLTYIQIFPISWRKPLIDICQTADPDLTGLYEAYNSNFPPSGQILGKTWTANPEKIRPHLEHIVRHHASRSILWVFLRCIPEPRDNDELYEVRIKGFLKEFGASQARFSDWQQLGYYGMTVEDNWPKSLVPRWAGMARKVVDSFMSKIKRFWLLYPQVNRRKNVSRETARLYAQRYPGTPLNEVRTVDLEVHYAKTGEHIQGSCELRDSFRYTELKPRFYYAQGGRDYHAAKYIKRFAVALMESVDATEMKRRINPDHILVSDPEDFLVMWDLTSFTSTLHELRYFLYWVTRGLEDRGDPSVEILDYREGRKFIKASELLYQYNETVNINSPFSIHRVIDKYCLQDSFDVDQCEQQNSGMLGVPGNIGFSTALHGYAIDQVSEKGKNVSVGDDAFSSRWDDPFETLFPHIGLIGILQLTKTQVIPPGYDGPAKFVKRRLERTETGFFIDFLLKLPLSVLVDERYGSRTPPDMDDYRRAKVVATTVGALVWSLTEHWDELVDHDIHLLQEYLLIVYNHFRFNIHGSLPGSKINVGGREYRALFAYPPVIFDEGFSPFQKDWLEFLIDEHAGNPISIPVMVPRGEPVMPEVGQKFFAPEDKGWRVLEDLGVVEDLGIQATSEKYIGEDNRRRLMAFIKGSKDLFPLHEFRLVSDCPDHFSYLFAPSFGVDYMSVLGPL